MPVRGGTSETLFFRSIAVQHEQRKNLTEKYMWLKSFDFFVVQKRTKFQRSAVRFQSDSNVPPRACMTPHKLKYSVRHRQNLSSVHAQWFCMRKKRECQGTSVSSGARSRYVTCFTDVREDCGQIIEGTYEYQLTCT